MIIVDEQIMTSTGDKTEKIAHKPILFRLRPDGTRDYTPEKEAYGGPLEFVVQPNLREIAGDKAFNYITGKREYAIGDQYEQIEESTSSSKTIKIIKRVVLVGVLISGAAVVANYFGAF